MIVLIRCDKCNLATCCYPASFNSSVGCFVCCWALAVRLCAAIGMKVLSPLCVLHSTPDGCDEAPILARRPCTSVCIILSLGNMTSCAYQKTAACWWSCCTVVLLCLNCCAQMLVLHVRWCSGSSCRACTCRLRGLANGSRRKRNRKLATGLKLVHAGQLSSSDAVLCKCACRWLGLHTEQRIKLYRV